MTENVNELSWIFMTALRSCIPDAEGKAKDKMKELNELPKICENLFLFDEICFLHFCLHLKTITCV